MCYVHGTLNLGLHICSSSQSNLVFYLDTDWLSSSGYVLFLGDNLISWSFIQTSEHHISFQCRSRVTCRCQCNRRGFLVMPAPSWAATPLCFATLVYCDNNISTNYMSSDHVQQQCTKHIGIDLHFVRELVALGSIHILHIPTTSQS
jgi:hypothetical protein